MFEIDKAKFGAFVAQLRKEKGLMQKELAENYMFQIRQSANGRED